MADEDDVMQVVISNLDGLHNYEEGFRVQSLQAIKQDSVLLANYTMSGISMDMVHILSITHPNQSEDELTIQKIGLRLFNNAATATKLVMTGYYQRALDIIRDSIELVFLLDYLRTNTALISVWSTSTTQQRKKQFSAKTIREALDTRDGYVTGKRKEMYDVFSEYASHASHQGFKLLVPKDTNLHTIGPFFFLEFLDMTLLELARHHCYAAAIFIEHFVKVSDEIAAGINGYYQYATNWRVKYKAQLHYADK